MNTKPQDWTFEFQQRGGQPILMADFWCRALSFNYPKEIQLEIEGLDCLMTSQNKGYYRSFQRDAVLQKFKAKLETDPTYIKYIFSATQQRVEEFSRYMETSDKQWGTFVEKVQALIPWFYIPWYITEYNIFSDRVIKGLEKFSDQIKHVTDLNNAAMLLMFPDKEMGFQHEQALFFDLVKKTKSGVPINTKEYLERFSWMDTFILVPAEPLDHKKLIAKIENAIQEKADETFQLQQERKEKDLQIVQKLEVIISKDALILGDIQNARHLAWMLTWSVEALMKAFACGIPWYKEIAQQIGVAYSDWAHLTISEVSESLKNNASVVTQSEIDERKKSHVAYMVDKTFRLITGDESKLFIEQLNIANAPDSHTSHKEVRGKSASPGKVKGKARICHTAIDARIVEEGDILMTSMTTPDYVPAMKRAGAIVTDEGGVLCHAAIISRELGKPCVIATKIATQIFKNGDMVEVDADSGIIKLL